MGVTRHDQVDTLAGGINLQRFQVVYDEDGALREPYQFSVRIGFCPIALVNVSTYRRNRRDTSEFLD